MRQFKTPAGEVEQLRFAPEGRSIYLISAEPHVTAETTCMRPQRVCRVDLDSGAITRDWPFKPSNAATFSPDLDCVYFVPTQEPSSQHSDHRYLQLLRLDSGTVRRLYRPDEFDIWNAVQCVVSPDGNVLAIVEYRQHGNVIRRLDLSTWSELAPIYQDAVWLAYSCDGRWLAAGGYNDRVWVWSDTDPVGEWSEHVNALAWSIDGLLAWGKEGWLTVVRPDTADSLRSWDVSDIGHFKSLAFSPDGRRILIGGYGGMCAIHDVAADREIAVFDWGIGHIHSVAFAPDGLTCAAGGENGQVVVWDVDA